MNRRSLLALLGAAPITGPAAVKAAMSGMAVSDSPSAGQLVGAAIPEHMNSVWRISGRLRDQREAARYAVSGGLSPHVAAKRSWSLAFKAHVHVHEETQFRDMLDRLERLDAAGVGGIARLLGMEP